MDKLLIISRTNESAGESATKIGLNSNQYHVALNLDQVKQLGTEVGLYCFTDNPPLDGVDIRMYLGTTLFTRLPNLVVPLKNYITEILNEIWSITDRFSMLQWTNSTPINLSNQLVDMFNSCNITKAMGFEYNIKFSPSHHLYLDPVSNKMKVLKDLINAVAIQRV